MNNENNHLDGKSISLLADNICKSFRSDTGITEVLKNITFQVRNGDFISLFGPNGCGKTTLIHIIAGIIRPDNGKVEMRNDAINENAIGIVFQDYVKTLLPWRNCLDNICLPLENSNEFRSKKTRRDKARQLLSELKLDLPLDNYPYQLSGGQKQLTCIARALVKHPMVMLLDEPFASLDYQTRMVMQEIFQRIWLHTRVTTVFVSHEIDEAIFMSNRLLLLSKRPAQIMEIYAIDFPRPRDLDIISSHKFMELKAEILRKFKKEVFY